MQVDLVQRGVDVARLIADHFELHVGGQAACYPREVLFHRLDDRHRVGARLAQNLQLHRRHAVEPRQRALLLGAVLGGADVAYANRRAVHRRHGEIVELARRDDAPHGAQDFFLSAAGDVAAGDVGVLAPDGVAHGGDRNLIGGEAIGVDPDIDCPVQVADQPNLANTRRTFQLNFDYFIGEFSQLAQ